MDIVIHDLMKSFGQVTVLNSINATWEGGKIHGIIGRNGSGKTVMLKCISGLIIPDSGEIRIGTRRVTANSQASECIGGIIENPGFLPNYSAYGNLKLLAGIRNRIGKEQIVSSIERVGLDPKSRKHVGKYSMGMKQRLGIAQAIMEDPDVIILDEPMNGLDNAGVREMRELFKSLRAQGKTIIMASHNREDIDELCDNVYEMDAGILTKVR